MSTKCPPWHNPRTKVWRLALLHNPATYKAWWASLTAMEHWPRQAAPLAAQPPFPTVWNHHSSMEAKIMLKSRKIRKVRRKINNWAPRFNNSNQRSWLHLTIKAKVMTWNRSNHWNYSRTQWLKQNKHLAMVYAQTEGTPTAIQIAVKPLSSYSTVTESSKGITLGDPGMIPVAPVKAPPIA